MLDPTMMYSCARLRAPRRRRSRRRRSPSSSCVCEKLDLGPRDHVLEIGTGWGGFAVHAATHARLPRDDDDDLARAARRTPSQRVARGRARATASRCCSRTTATCAARYDKLVSIEMIEAVGWQDFGTFFERCSRPAGARRRDAAAGDHDRRPRLRRSRRRRKSFIRTYIFPGGCLPSLEVIARCVRAAHRPAHGRTSRTSRRTTPRRCGAGARTSRRATGRARRRSATTSASGGCGGCTSSYCEAGFAERRIGVVQTVLAKPLAGIDALADGAAPVAQRPRLPAEHPAAERVEHERRAARGELGERELAARADDVVVRPRRRRRPSPPTPPARPCPSSRCPCGGRRPPRWRRACRC